MTLVFSPGLVLAAWAIAVMIDAVDPVGSFVPFIVAEVVAWFAYIAETRRRLS